MDYEDAAKKLIMYSRGVAKGSVVNRIWYVDGGGTRCSSTSRARSTG